MLLKDIITPESKLLESLALELNREENSGRKKLETSGLENGNTS